MNKLTNFCNDLVQKYLPDPFVLAFFLIATIFVSGVIWTPSTPLDMVKFFGGGLWGMLAFSMQLSFVIISASAVAQTPPIKKIVKYFARIPKTPTQAVFYVSFITSLVGLLNWGIALVVGIIYAKEVAREVKGTHFPLLIAASYAGFTLWSTGISSSIPLALNTPGHALEKFVGLIPLTETIFSPYNIILILVLIFTYAFTCSAMTPPPEKTISLDPQVFEEEDQLAKANLQQPKFDTIAGKLENSRLISSLVGVLCLFYFLYSVNKGGINALNLNSVNLLTLSIGLLMYKGLVPYLKAASTSAKSVIPIMMLYPFYSAISAMIMNSGLGKMMTNFFASIATDVTLPVMTFLTAGFINFLIPADGGHLALQGPIFLPLAEKFGVSRGLISMAITYGANWSNMIQPFWALPALALAKLGIRDIMGYCLVVLVVSGVVAGFLFTLLPLILG